jgi:protease I
MPKKILIITGDAGESYEALYAKHRMAEAGYTPVIAAPRTGPLNLVMHDFEPGWDTYIEKPGYKLNGDVIFKEVKVSDYAAVILLGGRAPEYLRNDADVVEIVKEFARSGKYIFSICHGIQILVAADLVRGRKLTCYEHVKLEVTSAGGEWIAKESVRDGKFVTAQTWISHPEFYRDVMQCLQG